jgi:transposase InsO family protein
MNVGPDRLLWIIEDYHQELVTYLTRSTVYRILVRRRLHHPKPDEQETHTKRYTKSYPGEELQIDTTEPFGKGNGIQISAIDDYSRWGFADFYQRNTSLNAALFLTACIQSAPFPIKAVRTDHGSEFYGQFETTCTKLAITIIRNRVNTPEHNGKVERFHRTIDEECLWRTRAESEHPETVRFQLNRYLIWYNTKRRHGGVGMNKKTPQERIEDFILSKQVHPFIVDVNETLILYNSENCRNKRYDENQSHTRCNGGTYTGPSIEIIILWYSRSHC